VALRLHAHLGLQDHRLRRAEQVFARPTTVKPFRTHFVGSYSHRLTPLR